MFRKTRRFLAVVIPVALTTLAALWSAVLNKVAPSNQFVPIIYVGVIAALAGWAAYLTQIKPARDLEKPVRSFLAILAEKPLKIGGSLGVGPRINIMLIGRPWFLLGKRRIKVVWGASMDSFPDVQFSCNYDQGVAGMAIRNGKPVLHDCESSDRSEFGFTVKQLHQTSHVSCVWSWPIYEIDSKGYQTGRIVGVVNFDTTRPGAFAKLKMKTDALEKLLKKFAEVASTLV